MKIDFHVHSSERSACGQASEKEQIKAAITAGLDAIVFTDHGRLTPASRLFYLNHKYAPFRIFSGIEISLEEDILVIGLQDPVLESERWCYPELITYIRQKGGYSILAHPFRYHPEVLVDIERYPPDGIELYSVNTPTAWQSRIRELSQDHGITLYSNSDAHKAISMGLFFNTVPGFPESDAELIRALKTGPVNTSHR
jgi:hypothetical protein